MKYDDGVFYIQPWPSNYDKIENVNFLYKCAH